MAPGELFRRALNIDQLIDDLVDSQRQVASRSRTARRLLPTALPRSQERWGSEITIPGLHIFVITDKIIV